MRTGYVFYHYRHIVDGNEQHSFMLIQDAHPGDGHPCYQIIERVNGEVKNIHCWDDYNEAEGHYEVMADNAKLASLHHK